MNNGRHPHSEVETTPRRWRFATVLLASLLLAVAQPLASGLLDEQDSFDVFFSLLIAAVLLLVFDEWEHRRVALSLGLAAILAVWSSHALGGMAHTILLVGANLLAACFFTFALFGILRAILMKQATGDAICGYLLLGINWSLLYYAAEMAFPGSFAVPPLSGAEIASQRVSREALSYYSFITLSTVGYGDVTPATLLTRTLAWIEAITGQFYLAILVAGLVGFKVSQGMNRQGGGDS